MTKFPFSEDDLKAAAVSVSDAMLDSLPDPSEISFDLSDDFLRKMDALCAKARRRSRFHAVMKRVAVFFLALLLGLGAWLAADTEARAAVAQWLIEAFDNGDYDDIIAYRFSGHKENEPLPDYVLSWIPDDFALIGENKSDIRHDFYYEHEMTKCYILFSYSFMDEDTGYVISHPYDEKDSIRETLQVNGIPADYYPGDGFLNTSYLVWMDETAGLCFFINSDLRKTDILRMAESVSLCETTK